jgi:ATP-dependent RNA helicase SrmB
MIFDDLMLDPLLLKAVKKQGFVYPTPVQQHAIPALLEGKDVLACAATGTGKTAAFVLPIMQGFIDTPPRQHLPRVLILAPTRDLAIQIHRVVEQLGYGLSLHPVIVTGGLSPAKQIEYLEQDCDIITATPGRLLQLVTENDIDLSSVELVIVDEADRMLDMGQGPDVLHLMAALDGGFQTGLFSATLQGGGITVFAEEILKEPEHIQIHASNKQAETITQQVYLADSFNHKNKLLEEILKQKYCDRALVFCNKIERANVLTEWLQSRNISAQVLHGEFRQSDRMEKTRKFKQGKIKVMVATDVAARGLDIEDVSHVINYDLPYRGDLYIHRIGRTARAEKEGLAISLVEIHELKNLERIEYHLDTRLPTFKLPGLEPQLRRDKKGNAKPKKKPNKDKPRYVSKADREKAKSG